MEGKMKKTKNLSKTIILFVSLLCFFHMVVNKAVIVHAEEIQMFYTTEAAGLYEKENLASKILDTIDEETPVMILEQNEDFCKVQYKENVGYVETSKLQMENAEVAEEIDKQHDYNNALMNEVFRMENEKMKSRIWGGVIIGLVVLIFGIGIFHTVRTNHVPKTDKKMRERIKNVIEEAVDEDSNIRSK